MGRRETGLKTKMPMYSSISQASLTIPLHQSHIDTTAYSGSLRKK
ncbi:MAG: hypothetical protein PUH57_07280 [Prevotellaceae bacterium]|nr:hypothetical protein [Prevotellaceae bacterium]